MDVAGKVVVVTGAGRGIGAGLTRRFASEGAAVVVVDLDGDAAAELAGELSRADPSVRALAERVDVAVPEQVAALVERVETTVGPIQVFVANAGVGAGGGFDA